MTANHPTDGSHWRADLAAGATTAVPTTMVALLQPTLSGPHDMRLMTDAPVPVPGPGEILIRVAAAGVNYADVMRASGTYDGGPQPPFIAGFEAAGEVVALGPGVTEPGLGARVLGTGSGAFAEYMVVAQSAAIPVPDGWTETQSLGMVLNWATALAALKPLGRLVADETVLINAAAGGVGQAATRMAKHYGGTVIAAASPEKHHLVRALGADEVIDYRSADVAEEVLRLTDGRGADLILESVGGAVFASSVAAARRVTGRIVVYGVAGGTASISNWDLNFRHQVHLIGLHIGELIRTAPDLFDDLMRELAVLRDLGVFAPGRPTAYPLAEGQRALRELQVGATVGKLALLP